MMHSHINFEIFILHYWPDMRKGKKSKKSKIEKKNRCVSRFLRIAFLFRKMVNSDRNQNTPFEGAFKPCVESIGFRKISFGTKTE